MPGATPRTLAQYLARVVAVAFVCFVCGSCSSPTEPRDTNLSTGRWTGASGVCLSVAAEGCDLVAGCGHGHFPLPVVHADGTFAVTGTYRIEVGPVSINPAPPATFSGVQSNETLTLSVTPSDPSLRPETYVLRLTTASGKCAVPCV